VATAIVKRHVGLDDYTDSAIRNRDVLDVAGKMQVEVDNTLHKPGPEPTRVKVVTTDGKAFVKVVEHPLGSLERPMSFEDCARKFADCAKCLEAGRVERIVQQISQLEQLEDIQEIMRHLT
jgi:2-methylcitrate dehydratase PrpD